MRLRIGIIAMLLIAVNVAMAQDILVKKDGSILNVYNLEESNSSYFYTLEPSHESTVQKIGKDDVFSIKKHNDETLQPAAGTEATTPKRQPTHEPVTAQISSEIQTNKKGGRWFSARTPDGQELNYLILSDTDHTLAVAGGEYQESEYVIPEYVQVGNDIYTVTEICNNAFYNQKKIKGIQFPITLKRIGGTAFYRCGLESIILPEGLEDLGWAAFNRCGEYVSLSQIYLPSSVKKIGEGCFKACGKDASFRYYCQAYFTNMPDFITEGNCKSFGIDEEAVRAYNQKKSK